MNRQPRSATATSAERIAALVRTLRDTERELQTLVGGQPDAVVTVEGSRYLSREAQEKLQHSEAAQRQLAQTQIAILNALPAHIALVAVDGTILSVNKAWRDFGAANALQGSDFGVGQNYLTLCDTATGACSEEAHAVAAGLRQVLSGNLREFAIEYPCHSPEEQRWFRLMITPLDDRRPAGAVVTHINITERKLAELERQKLVRDLGERVKELRALHGVAELLQRAQLTATELLAGVAALLPAAMQHPEAAAARVGYGGVERATADFRPSAWELRANFLAAGASGWVEVVYLTDQPAAALGPFLQEEHHLIQSLADMLRAYFERCAAEAALRTSEASMAAAQRIAHFGSWELELTNQADINANPLRWSDEMFRIAGYEPGRVRVSNELFFQLAHPDDHELIRRAVAEAIRERRQYSIVHRLIRPNGEERVVHEVAQIFFDDQTGQPVKMVGTTHDITEQRRAETALRRTEELYRRAIGAAGAVPYASDFRTRSYQFIGEGIEQLIGYPPHEVTGGLWRQIIEEAVMQGAASGRTKEEAAQLVLDGKLRHWRCDMRVRTRSGESRWISDTSIQDVDDAGKPIGAIGILQDITERKHAEAVLRQRESEQRLLALQLAEAQAIAKLGSWRTDLATQEVVWSEETFRIFETTPEEFHPTHQGFLQLVHPEDRAAVDAAFVRSLQVTTPCTIEHRLQLPDGRIKYLEERWRTFQDARGKPLRAAGTCQDITERKLVELRIKETEERYRALFERSLDAVYVHDLTGRFVDANPAALKLLGYSKEDIASLDFSSLLTSTEDMARAHQSINAHLSATIPEGISEYRLKRKDGSIIWVELVSGLVFANGQPVAIQGIARDITERKLAERRMSAFANLGRRLGIATTAREAARTIAETADELFGWDACWLHVYDATRGISHSVLNLDLVAGHRQDVPPAYSGTAPSPLVRRILDQGSELILRDPATSPVPGLTPFGDTSRPSASIMLVPVRHGGEAIAVFSIQSYTPNAYRPEDLRQLEALADYCGGALAQIQARDAQRESEERFRQMAENISKVFWVTDATKRQMLYISPAYETIWGRTCGSLYESPRDWIEAIHPEDRERILTAAQTRQTTGEYDEIYRINRPDGIVRWVRDRAFPVRNAAGEVYRIVGTAEDITERKQAEAERERLLEINLRLLESSSEGIYGIDEHGRCTFINTAAARLLGYTALEVLGQDTHALFHHHHPDGTPHGATDCPVQRALTTGQSCRVEDDVFWRKDGTPLAVQFASSPIMDAGRAIGAVVTFSDITERKRAHERLREQAALLDAAHEAILVKSLEDHIVYWNKGAERLYGWTAAEVLDRKSSELLHPDPAAFQAALAGLLQNGEWQGEMEIRAKDGRHLLIDVRWTLVRDEQSRPKAVLAINTDITEKKKLEARFLRAQRMESIGTLAGGIAHDLNNVLAPILMSVEMLREWIADAEGRALLATLEQSAQRGAELVKQVLTFARGIEGRRIAVNPLHLVRELRKIIQDTFPRNIEFKLETERDLWLVNGDPTQLHQVLMNLCVNARDAMPDGGKLTVTLANRVIDEVYAGMNPESQAGAYVLIKVADTGTGMSAATREKIFEPFFTTKEVGKGTGLGLSTTLAIVKSHGGFINVYSEVGKGTKFKVYLPARTSAQAAEITAVEQTQLPRGRGELILVVDDEESIRSVAQKTLERFGYRVLLATQGAEAVAFYAQRRTEIAAVLTDMAMPIMDGPATIIALRAMNPAVKIIGSSGLASNDGVAKLVGAGVQRFVPKPYTAEILLKTLREVLDEPPGKTPGPT